MTALRVLAARPLRRRGRGDPAGRRPRSSSSSRSRCDLPGRRRRLLLRRRRRDLRRRLRAAARGDAARLPRARRRPATAPASRTRSTRCCGAASGPGEPSWACSVRPRPARLAHRVQRDRAWPTSGPAFDVQGGGSDLVFPHHEMSAGHTQAVAPGCALRPGLRARRDGGLRRREDVEVPRQPGLRVGAAPVSEVDPMAIRLAAAAATTTAATGSDLPGSCWRPPRRPRPVARRGRAGPRGPCRGRASRRCSPRWPTTSTRPAAPSAAGSRHAGDAADTDPGPTAGRACSTPP